MKRHEGHPLLEELAAVAGLRFVEATTVCSEESVRKSGGGIRHSEAVPAAVLSVPPRYCIAVR